MKNILIVCLALIRASCNGVAGWFGSADSTNTSTTTDTDVNTAALPGRDYSITESNSYSDLFLDSGALDRYIQQENIPANEARLLHAFYGVRNFQFAWMASDGLTDEGRGFWNRYAGAGDTSTSDHKAFFGGRELQTQMDTLLAGDSLMLSPTDSGLVRTELTLSRVLVQKALKGDDGTIHTGNFYYLVPAKKRDPLQAADSLLRSKDSASHAANRQWMALRDQLAIYYDAAKKGGWQSIPTVGTMRKGMSAPTIVALKKRLQLTGDYPLGDTSAVYTDSLFNTVHHLQTRYGLNPSGRITDSLINVLNVPVEERLSQILLNMNRAAWQKPTTDSNRIEVDVPGQMLYVYEGSNQRMAMPVIVGREGNSTLMFEGAIRQVVFSPYWNVPESIVKNEIMPAMKKDPSYLKKKNMEVVKQGDSLPVIRQLPGKGNSLGGVKFLFPNRFDIFLHDTPDKNGFAKNDRALSHGCIRVAKPDSLAKYLLRHQPEWTAAKISQAMKGGREQVVNVKEPVTVLIRYQTAFVDDKGVLHFRNDIYGHDARARMRLFPQGG